MLKRLFLAAFLACAACATPPAPVTGLQDTSFTAPNGSRTIQLSAWFAAPPAEVFQIVATPEGWRKWAAPVAMGEVKLNGVLETSYNPNAKPGDAGNIKQQFTELVPNKRVAFRTIQTPEGFPHGELYKQTSALMELTPEAGGTRLRFTHSGFGTGKEWDELHGFFVQGDRQTLEELRKVLGE
ncbi:MAG: SRPBCC domain-containing protein [Burkholderiales bacterium]|nr:MAG: SRPBCC domain-containing protein [Burkholderiales bacterium]